MRKKKSGKSSKKPIKSTGAQKSKGLGDTVEKVFKATGVDKVAKWILGEDCGCEERKQTLNRLFPYVNPECLTESEYNYLHKYFTDRPNVVDNAMQLELLKIYNRVLHQNSKTTSCTPCFLNNIQDKLYKIYSEYEK
tara:strand:+ start:5093 stop:5503 length:411 start_codon:yes stop_codon:yes gene_type:complete